MRILILVVTLVALFALAGWLTFSSDEGQSSIHLETNEIRQDTGEAMHKGAELLHQAEEEVTPESDQE